MDLVFGVLISTFRRDPVTMVGHAYPFLYDVSQCTFVLLLLGRVAISALNGPNEMFSCLISCPINVGTESKSVAVTLFELR